MSSFSVQSALGGGSVTHALTLGCLRSSHFAKKTCEATAQSRCVFFVRAAQPRQGPAIVWLGGTAACQCLPTFSFSFSFYLALSRSLAPSLSLSLSLCLSRAARLTNVRPPSHVAFSTAVPRCTRGPRNGGHLADCHAAVLACEVGAHACRRCLAITCSIGRFFFDFSDFAFNSSLVSVAVCVHGHRVCFESLSSKSNSLPGRCLRVCHRRFLPWALPLFVAFWSHGRRIRLACSVASPLLLQLQRQVVCSACLRVSLHV